VAREVCAALQEMRFPVLTTAVNSMRSALPWLLVQPCLRTRCGLVYPSWTIARATCSWLILNGSPDGQDRGRGTQGCPAMCAISAILREE